MSGIIQGVLIDAIKKEISRVEVHPDEKGSYLDSVKKHLELGMFGTVDVMRDRLSWLPSKPKDDIWINAEMLDEHFGFIAPQEGLFVYGKSLILDWDPDGKCISTSLLDDDVAALRSAGTFMTL